MDTDTDVVAVKEAWANGEKDADDSEKVVDYKEGQTLMAEGKGVSNREQKENMLPLTASPIFLNSFTFQYRLGTTPFITLCALSPVLGRWPTLQLTREYKSSTHDPSSVLKVPKSIDFATGTSAGSLVPSAGLLGSPLRTTQPSSLPLSSTSCPTS